MMQTILSGLVGIFFTALVLGLCWFWFLKSLVKTFLASCKGFAKSVGGTFNLGISIGNKLIKTDEKKVVEPEGVVTEASVVFDAISAPNYEIAKWVKGHPVKKLGYVLLRGYSNHLERCLVIDGNPTIQKKHGRRIQLANLEGSYLISDTQVVEQTIEEATKLVELSVSKIESKSSAPKAIVVKEPAIEPSSVTTAVPAVNIAPSPVPTTVSAVKKDKALEAYKGFLISYGKAVRHISAKKDDESGNDSGQEIEQFRVVIRSEDGIEESIWGADLLRAIKDANIYINDMVEVIKTGKRKIGTASWKNLYVVNKLA